MSRRFLIKGPAVCQGSVIENQKILPMYPSESVPCSLSLSSFPEFSPPLLSSFFLFRNGGSEVKKFAPARKVNTMPIGCNVFLCPRLYWYFYSGNRVTSDFKSGKATQMDMNGKSNKSFLYPKLSVTLLPMPQQAWFLCGRENCIWCVSPSTFTSEFSFTYFASPTNVGHVFVCSSARSL